MSAIVLGEKIRIPDFVDDLESFRCWARSDDFPEQGRFSHLNLCSTSVEKDTLVLRGLYWQADIPEYWLVDARGDRLQFDILRRHPDGYVPTRKQRGWLESAVFGKSFRLSSRPDELGHPEYTLSVQ
ncbi:MAG: hypothetical protein H8E44_07500 [Planctomycetes bacterium]|nr:hypothetical protein [Planctomycetota bacterium]